jgi:hypothetical protein
MQLETTMIQASTSLFGKLQATAKAIQDGISALHPDEDHWHRLHSYGQRVSDLSLPTPCRGVCQVHRGFPLQHVADDVDSAPLYIPSLGSSLCTPQPTSCLHLLLGLLTEMKMETLEDALDRHHQANRFFLTDLSFIKH